MRSEKLKLKCSVLTPFHIGTGEEIAVYDYIIKDGFLLKVNLNSLFSLLEPEQREKLNTYSERGDFLGTRKFIQDTLKEDSIVKKVVQYQIPVTENVEKNYHENFTSMENQLLVRLHTRHSLNGNPVIPGSSVKGAIRTAVLDDLAKNAEKLSGRIQEVEGILLDANRRNRKGEYKFQVTADPFKYLKVPDIALSNGSSYICSVKNVIKTAEGQFKANEMQMIHEVLNSQIAGKDLTFEAVLDMGMMQVQNKKTLHPDDIINACRRFYHNILVDYEMDYYEGSPWEDIIFQIRDMVRNEAQFLLRVGRFSGLESITIGRLREPKRAKSRNLAEEKYPMGWIRCEVI